MFSFRINCDEPKQIHSSKETRQNKAFNKKSFLSFPKRSRCGLQSRVRMCFCFIVNECCTHCAHSFLKPKTLHTILLTVPNEMTKASNKYSFGQSTIFQNREFIRRFLGLMTFLDVFHLNRLQGFYNHF